MGQQPDTSQTLCFVDASERVYYVGGRSTWRSTNLAVNWQQISSNTSYFSPPRTDFGGAIWSPSPGVETVVIMGGRIDPSTASINDVWVTYNYGASWTRVSASAPWIPRQDPNVAVSANGVIVLEGGQSYYNNSWNWSPEIWASFDTGMTWFVLNPMNAITPGRSLAALTFDASGFLHISSGVGPGANGAWNWFGDNWRSTYSFNNIQTWAATTVPNVCMPTTFCAPAAVRQCTYGISSSAGNNPGTSSSSSSGLGTGAIVGIVIGSVIGGLLIICGCLFFLCSGLRSKKKQAGNSQFNQHDDSAAHSHLDEVEMEQGGNTTATA